jgi:hypothetical protein
MPVPLRRCLFPFLLIVADGSYGVIPRTNGEGGRALIPAVIDALWKAEGHSAFTPPEG